MSLKRIVDNLTTQQIDFRSLAVVRVILGYALILRGFLSWKFMNQVYGQGLCTLPVFDWLPILPSNLIPAYCGLWCLVAFCFMVGWKPRLMGILQLGLILYFMAMDQQFYASHLYLLFLICLLVTLGDSSGRLLRETQTDRHRELVFAWPASLIKIQMSIVYLFGGLTKINETYLSGSVLARSLRVEGALAIPESWIVPAILSVFALCSVAMELFLAVGFWLPSFRKIAYLGGIAFHTGLVIWVDPTSTWDLIVFSLAMFSMYTLFFWPISEQMAQSQAVSSSSVVKPATSRA